MKKQKLKKSQSNRMIAGVCGGLSEYFGPSANVFRLIFLVLALAGSAGIWIYLILAIAM